VGESSDTGFRLLLKQAERELMGSLERHQPEEPFFHYTDKKGLEGILESATIWGTEYQRLNDTTELTHGESAIDAELEAIRSEYSDATARGSVCLDVIDIRSQRRFTQMGYNVYVTSFSSAGDLLGQWERYADKAKGFAIGFRALPLPVGVQTPRGLDAGLASDFQTCVYSEAEYRAMIRRELFLIADGLHKYIDTYHSDLTEEQGQALNRSAVLTTAARLGASTPYFKHHAFAEEREWRLVHIGTPPRQLIRPTSFGDAEYVEVPLRRPDVIDLHSVVTGPRCPQRDRDLARAVLDRLDYAHVPVVASKVPLR
jgi:hypothetical protein